MSEHEVKRKLMDAITDGIGRARFFVEQTNKIEKIIDDADSAINNVYSDVSIKQKATSNGSVQSIVVIVSVGNDAISRKLMEIDIPKGDSFHFVVRWREGTSISYEPDELVDIFQKIFSSPSFWSDVSIMREQA